MGFNVDEALGVHRRHAISSLVPSHKRQRQIKGETRRMPVSLRVSYEWICPKCGLSQVSPIWRLLDARERSDVLQELPPGLAHVLCSQCGEAVGIDAPLLLIR